MGCEKGLVIQTFLHKESSCLPLTGSVPSKYKRKIRAKWRKEKTGSDRDQRHVVGGSQRHFYRRHDSYS